MDYEPSEWISLSEAARRVRTSPAEIKKLITDERLSVMTRTGKRSFVRADEVKALAETWVRPRSKQPQ